MPMSAEAKKKQSEIMKARHAAMKESAHVHSWVSAQYRSHEGGLRITDVYCPTCKEWQSVAS